ncbi:MAG TPA: MFS transporter [Steroidobacteraceae bacterium]|nr:MFS transporter [Gammaproteobacteria bacterium]HEV2286360.1 MFS transporter [Steroidobacteraceae bacterium]
MATVEAAADAPQARALRRAQSRTLLLLFLGYASCYFCRANLPVATPLLIEELGTHGVGHDDAMLAIGWMGSAGVFAYALGKWFLTSLGDYWGGKRNLLIATGGATLFTLLFAASGTLPVFTLAWIANRLSQSIGWSALVKVSSKWFHYSRYGTVAAFLSCSYLIGDAIARPSMGLLLQHGVSWRGLFVFGAAVAGAMFLANLLWLRESSTDEGFPAAVANPGNVFAHAERPHSYLALVLPLLRSRAFLTVCLLGFATTMIRETFNTWTPSYLHDFLGLKVSEAAVMSAVFPGVGGLSAILAGWASDRLGHNCRALLLVAGLAATAVGLLVLTQLRPGSSGTVLPVVMIGVVAFCLLGPYVFLPGAFALDFGGQQAGAVASGLVDGTGYFGGVAAGSIMAWLAVRFGWGGMFTALAAVSSLAALGAAYLWILILRPAPATAASS